ncbi:GNAT family N-acetyltransferase [Nonomuraea sp. NPDC050790]|uniref:GNAT family N-acetyltransferase n=1 Tax=Nonomuraea sp. NPDC050790 TaxID=3364371 RepID=UPI0037A4EF9B
MWSFTADLAAFPAAATAFLLDDPVGNTVPLTVMAAVRSGQPAEGAYYGWWSVDGQVRGVAFRTPPAPLGLAVMPAEAVAELATALGEREIPEVMGPRELVGGFSRARGAALAHTVEERLYRLGRLTPPDVPGEGRRAVPGDLPLLVSWYHAFGEEISVSADRGDQTERVLRRIASGDLFLWTDGGAPVSFAGLSIAQGGVSRIGPVYTPPSCRRRGYGAAITAHASRVGLDERAKEIVLFTDLGNPTSNAIYRSIGYEPHADYAHVTYAP